MTVKVYPYSTVVDIIKEINELHRVFSVSSKEILVYNLKRNIDNVVTSDGIDQSFQKLINDYKSEMLGKLTLALLVMQSKFPGIRYMFKQMESIREKLMYYLSEEHEYGKVAINKSLNDFLGFRILVDDLEDVYQSLRDDREVSTIVARMYLRQKGVYTGLHIYFKNRNNYFFPWELQIWARDHLESNELSHKKHKQKRRYISLPMEYREADLEKEE